MNVGPVSDQVIGAGIVRVSLAQTWTDGCDVINAAKFLIVQEDNTAVLLSCSHAEKTRMPYEVEALEMHSEQYNWWVRWKG